MEVITTPTQTPAPKRRRDEPPTPQQEEKNNKSILKRQKSQNDVIFSLLEDDYEDDDDPLHDFSSLFSSLQNELSSDTTHVGSDPTRLGSSSAESDPGCFDEMRQLLEASDDELGIPNREGMDGGDLLVVGGDEIDGGDLLGVDEHEGALLQSYGWR